MRALAFTALTLLAAPAAADPQFVTLHRADRESRVGVQGSLQLYPDLDDVHGLRSELFGQVVGNGRGGGAFGGYAHLALNFLFAEINDATGVSALEIGGYYVAALGGRGVDLIFHVGLSLPTASDDGEDVFAGFLLGHERNIDHINYAPEVTALKLGGTLKAPLGAGGFIQGDLAFDLPVDEPDGQDSDLLIHANLGIGAYVGPSALLAELATTSSDGDVVGSIALGIRFQGAAHPHIAYVLAFNNADEGVINPRGIVAHILSFGLYASF